MTELSHGTKVGSTLANLHSSVRFESLVPTEQRLVVGGKPLGGGRSDGDEPMTYGRMKQTDPLAVPSYSQVVPYPCEVKIEPTVHFRG